MFRAFGCQAYMYLNEEWRGKGNHIPRAVQAINLAFATDQKSVGTNPLKKSVGTNCIFRL